MSVPLRSDDLISELQLHIFKIRESQSNFSSEELLKGQDGSKLANLEVLPFEIGPLSDKFCVSAGKGISPLVWASALKFDQPDCVIIFS